MAIILIIACSNFICISCGVQRTVEQTKESLSRIDSIYMSSSSKSNNEDEQNTINFQINEIKESVRELNSLKKGIFDSNTITFLSSFVLVFLGGILFDIEKRAKEKLAKSVKITKKIEVEFNQVKILNQTNTISILSKYLQLQLSSKEYKIDDNINYITNELYKSLQYLLTLLQNKETKYLTEDAKKEYLRELHETQLLLGKEDIHNLDYNKDKLTYIISSQKLVSQSINLIESMKDS